MKIIIASMFVFAAAFCFTRAEGKAPQFGTRPEVSRTEALALREAAEISDIRERLEVLRGLASRKNAGAAVFFNLANACYENGLFEEAAANYAKSVEICPSFFVARKNYGFLLDKLGRKDAARAQLRSALALSGAGDVPILLWFASESAKSADFSAALNFCNQALLYEPDNDGALVAKAKFLCELGLYSEAEKLAESLLHKKPPNAAVLRTLGVARFKGGNIGGAIAAFEQMASIGGAESADVGFLADLYFSAGVFDKAMPLYLKAGNSAKAAHAAEIMAENGEYASALSVAEKLPAPEGLKIAAVCHAGEGRNALARRYFERYAEQNPSDTRMLLKYADFLLKTGETEASLSAYTRLSAEPHLRRSALYGVLACRAKMGDVALTAASAKKIATEYPSEEISKYVEYLESQK